MELKLEQGSVNKLNQMLQTNNAADASGVLDYAAAYKKVISFLTTELKAVKPPVHVAKKTTPPPVRKMPKANYDDMNDSKESVVD